MPVVEMTTVMYTPVGSNTLSAEYIYHPVGCKIMAMTKQDPVAEALTTMEDAMPQSLKPFVEAYKNGGIDALDPAWKQIIRDTINENK